MVASFAHAADASHFLTRAASATTIATLGNIAKPYLSRAATGR